MIVSFALLQAKRTCIDEARVNKKKQTLQFLEKSRPATVPKNSTNGGSIALSTISREIYNCLAWDDARQTTSSTTTTAVASAHSSTTSSSDDTSRATSQVNGGESSSARETSSRLSAADNGQINEHREGGIMTIVDPALDTDRYTTPIAANPRQQRQAATTGAISDRRTIAPTTNPAHVLRNKLTELKEVIGELQLDKQCPRFCRCFHSRKVMTDPVVACDGYSYERNDILEWLDSHETSPVTGELLSETLLYPNHQLRLQILQWVEETLAEAKRRQRAENEQKCSTGRKRARSF
eukprot:gb/GECG01003953.1/.p1 GENE.gb/GECG01003953.1/~~gb/GECG01003953.1/.p1  ORF type:complete len:295 (+),score=25.94 gb/GECG01003953.1/:1-885(+)